MTPPTKEKKAVIQKIREIREKEGDAVSLEEALKWQL